MWDAIYAERLQALDQLLPVAMMICLDCLCSLGHRCYL